MQGLLIAGTPHYCKSTLARRVGAALQWPVTSTDELARHPGRPWPRPPELVRKYYENLSDETIDHFLRWHHVVELNAAAAMSMVEGPARALQLVDALAAAGPLEGYWPLHAARAELLWRLDRPTEAHAAYARATACAD